MRIELKLMQTENISSPIDDKCDNVSTKGLLSRILVYLVWPLHSAVEQSVCEKIGSRLLDMTIYIPFPPKD